MHDIIIHSLLLDTVMILIYSFARKIQLQ